MRLTQLRLQGVALRFHIFARTQITGKDGGGAAVCPVLKRQAELDGYRAAAGRAASELTKLALGTDRRAWQKGNQLGQKSAQIAAQGIGRRAGEQGLCSGVEDRDAAHVVNTDDGIERGINDGGEPLLA